MVKEKLIKDINNFIDKIIVNFEIISNKELIHFVEKEFENEYDLDKLDYALYTRFKLSSLNKEEKIERIANGLYKVKNKHNESWFKYNKGYFRNNKEDKDILNYLETNFKGKWSWAGMSLLRSLGLTEQINPYNFVNIKLRDNNKNTKIREYFMKNFNHKIRFIYINNELNLDVYSLVETMTTKKIAYDYDQIYKINMFMQAKGIKETGDLIEYFDFIMLNDYRNTVPWNISEDRKKRLKNFTYNYNALIKSKGGLNE